MASSEPAQASAASQQESTTFAKRASDWESAKVTSEPSSRVNHGRERATNSSGEHQRR